MERNEKLCVIAYSFFVLCVSFYGQKYFFSYRKIKLSDIFFVPNYYSKIFKFDLDK